MSLWCILQYYKTKKNMLKCFKYMYKKERFERKQFQVKLIFCFFFFFVFGSFPLNPLVSNQKVSYTPNSDSCPADACCDQQNKNQFLHLFSQFLCFLFGKEKWSQLYNFQTSQTHKPHSKISPQSLCSQFPNHMGYYSSEQHVRIAFSLVMRLHSNEVLFWYRPMFSVIICCPLVEVCKGSGAAVTTATVSEFPGSVGAWG